MNANSERLPPNQQLLEGDRWPIVGESRCLPASGPWMIAISGLVEPSCEITLAELKSFGLENRRLDIHCVTRWSRYDMEFRGISLERVFTELGVSVANEAAFVSFVARTERRHSSTLPFPVALELGAFLAVEYAGQPLADDHGGPVRVVVPGKYFYKSVKWVEQIELLRDDRLGYWESDAGYHNEADPWREQRYIAAKLSKPQAAELIAKRDFTGRDLLGLAAADRDLDGLQAVDALLRDADFRRASLVGADFSRANLSNAHFQDARLNEASFVGADLDGADFSGADLRGCDLRVGSMFGTTFHSADAGQSNSAILDHATRLDETKMHGLTDQQRAFLKSRIS